MADYVCNHIEGRQVTPGAGTPRRPFAPGREQAVMCRLMCSDSHMATNLALDPDLLNRALAVSGEKTKKATVTKALEEFIARREQKRLLELFAHLEWVEGFDYKRERSRS